MRKRSQVRRALEGFLRQLMEAEVTARVGAGIHERSEKKATWRNGYRRRGIETSLGLFLLQIPQLREGSYFPSFLEPRKRSERALVAVVKEAYVLGFSTRSVDDLVQALGCTGIDKSTVSPLCRELDEEAQLFRSRPIEGEVPYVRLDAVYEKAREGGHVRSTGRGPRDRRDRGGRCGRSSGGRHTTAGTRRSGRCSCATSCAEASPGSSS